MFSSECLGLHEKLMVMWSTVSVCRNVAPGTQNGPEIFPSRREGGGCSHEKLDYG